ncbi:MAG: transcription elongation factor GreA [Clostridia bacterium]|nr:transcription elongation factor GreA [Clostridia bacterium]
MAEKIKVTAEGYKKLTDELNYLKNVKRQEIAENIKTARGFGDLSENSEYDEAKNEQAVVEARIKELEEKVKHVEIIEVDSTSQTINVGSKVRIKFLDTDEEEEYEIVGSTEADALNNKISYESPIGKAMVGSKSGKTVVVEAPDDLTYKIKILKILG